MSSVTFPTPKTDVSHLNSPLLSIIMSILSDVTRTGTLQYLRILPDTVPLTFSRSPCPSSCGVTSSPQIPLRPLIESSSRHRSVSLFVHVSEFLFPSVVVLLLTSLTSHRPRNYTLLPHTVPGSDLPTTGSVVSRPL